MHSNPNANTATGAAVLAQIGKSSAGRKQRKQKKNAGLTFDLESPKTNNADAGAVTGTSSGATKQEQTKVRVLVTGQRTGDVAAAEAILKVA